MFTFATTLTAVGAVAACSSSSSSGPTTNSGSDGAVQDDGQVQAAYGCPEPYCGQEDAGPVIDDGGVGALYGASYVDSGDND
jgi:hypothetical protein